MFVAWAAPLIFSQESRRDGMFRSFLNATNMPSLRDSRRIRFSGFENFEDAFPKQQPPGCSKPGGSSNDPALIRKTQDGIVGVITAPWDNIIEPGGISCGIVSFSAIICAY